MTDKKVEEGVKTSNNFIHSIIEEDLISGVKNNYVHTRFPPEPNGYLHIGHAKSICLNFGTALKYNGKCNLRFDDTNPAKEDVEYVESIREDVRWLGFDWDDREYFASDYFNILYSYAEQLIKSGKAYVCKLTAEQIAEQKGSPTRSGTESPYRNSSIETNLELFRKMKAGEFDEGSHVLRAKIDMSSPNMHMRDPIIYRIIKEPHHRTGKQWCIYPMYDFAHGQCDSIEGITYSLCTLEFEVHRPLYEWFIKELNIFPSRQIEFARLNMTYTVMSKRKLLELVKNNYVNGWDDPRMPTISGLRRRGYTPAAIRNFADIIGVAKRENIIDIGLLEHCVREDLNKTVQRRMAVLNPVKLTITNYPEHKTEKVNAINNPENSDYGVRELNFSRNLYIEQEDFMENPPKDFYRLAIGREVRLKYSYIIKCESIIKDPDTGKIIEILCSYDPETKSGQPNANRKVKSTIHWLNIEDSVKTEFRIYDRLFKEQNPEVVDGNYLENLNTDSLKIVNGFVEPSVIIAKPLDKFQFERIGYFCVDKETTEQKPIINRTVALRDNWAKSNANTVKSS